MLNSNLRVGIDIAVPPETVFAYLADLTKHGEWSANPLEIEAVSSGAVAVGSRYSSRASVGGAFFDASIEVIAYQPPFSFGFAGEDSTGKFEHHFTLRAHQGGTYLERKIDFNLNLFQWLMFYLLLFPVRIPAAKDALRRFKNHLEKSAYVS